jgi:ketol-acid reductoisomerase
MTDARARSSNHGLALRHRNFNVVLWSRQSVKAPAADEHGFRFTSLSNAVRWISLVVCRLGVTAQLEAGSSYGK